MPGCKGSIYIFTIFHALPDAAHVVPVLVLEARAASKSEKKGLQWLHGKGFSISGLCLKIFRVYSGHI